MRPTTTETRRIPGITPGRSRSALGLAIGILIHVGIMTHVRLRLRRLVAM
jgi:hypothetical protein